MRIFTNLLLIFMPLMAWSAPPADAPSFFAQFSEIAQEEMKNHDIPASIKLGQAALESGWGKSELALHGNNYFGLKCRSANECTNRTYKMKDDDYDTQGNLIKSTFMAFNNPQESFFMHSQFLKSNMARYGKLFDLPKGDYKGWAYGLKEAGYATAPDYAEKLIEIIEKYHLYKYDQQVINNSYQYNSKVDALNALAAAAQPSNPVKEETFNRVNENGSFGSESIVGYQPASTTNTTVNDFPSAPENPRASNDAMASNTTTLIVDDTPENIFEQNFGSEDVSDYVPDSFKEIFEEDTAKGITQQLDKVPSKKMLGGGTQPR